ncbi:uncharacterized protein LOC125479048 [Pyrus x bretschneideri]|uniref:uncharacterized protein LOC125479048 n=1 Tax=Pyrus x bretschneideri TaxID=225117 RepID=UPI00202DCC93|nr:uncharacterized protein LOC125479048 [Pyrus x bretschneideri]
MQEPRETHMVAPCDTCGSGNDENLIATCRKCNIARAHPYCMRKVDMEAWEDWICEECLGEEDNLASPTDFDNRDVMHPSGPSRVLADSGWQKPIGTGKVKYISQGEVIRLSSGVETTRSQRNTFSSKPGQSSSTALMSQKTTFGSKIATTKYPTPAIKANPSIVPSGYVKPPSCGRNANMLNISKINQQTFPILKDSKGTNISVAYGKEHVRENQSKDVLAPGTSVETKTPGASGKEHVREKQPADVLVPRPYNETSRKKMEAAIKKEPFTVATMRHSSPISSPGKCYKTDNIFTWQFVEFISFL